ncbi:MAG: beta-propeller fold lactonase family protein [Armatimonadetes bacterium]|nr:beta-propeller fold lactonase family protein [Armatimonadota bacterium]
MKKAIVFCLIIFLFLNLTFAQNSGMISGVVLTPTGKEGILKPLEGVDVALSGTNFKTKTNSSGGFIFSAVPMGNYKITASKEGYFVEEKQAALNSPTALRISLIIVPDTYSQKQVKSKDMKTLPEGEIVFIAFAALPNPKTHSVAPSLIDIESNNLSILDAVSRGYDPTNPYGGANPLIIRNPHDPMTPTGNSPNTLFLFNPADPQRSRFLNLNTQPYWIIYNQATKRLYLADQNERMLVIDPANNSIDGAITFRGIITDLALSFNGEYIYAAIMHSFPKVAVISAFKNKIINVINLPQNPWGVAASKDGNFIYVSAGNSQKGEVYLINPKEEKNILKKVSVGANPSGLNLSPDGKFLYAANYNSGTVSVIETSSFNVIDTLRVGIQPARIAVSASAKKAYVSCNGSNDISVIDLNSNQVINTIKVGTGPTGIAVSSDGQKVYVANNKDGTVSIIDTRADLVIQTTTPIPESQPWGIAVK